MAACREGKQRGMDAIHIAYLLQGVCVCVCIYACCKINLKVLCNSHFRPWAQSQKNDYHYTSTLPTPPHSLSADDEGK